MNQKILQMMYYGNPCLRAKADPIEKVTNEIRQMAKEMLATMDAHKGIGLAATQVGVMVRLFILRNYELAEDGSVRLTHPQAYINPRLEILGQEGQMDMEGCLSIPGIQEHVLRPLRIRVEAIDLDGRPFTEELEGYKARVVMHETDHLNGVLFIDRIDPERRKEIEQILRKIKKTHAPKRSN